MIRKLREADLGRVMTIENATSLVPWTTHIFKDCLDAGYLGWVLEQDGTVVGFGLLSLRQDEAHLLNLSIDPGYQKRGLGKALLDHVIKAAKSAGAMMIYLEVRESNLPAIKLYEKANFIQIDLRPDYYPLSHTREDALVFALDLELKLSF